jgi:hypothetical protein
MHHRSKPEPPDSINQEKLKLNDKHSKMKTCITIIFFLLANYFSTAQPGKKPAAKEKPPTQKEMEAMMKEAEKMMGEMSPEDKKMMDSMGIKMPSFKNVPQVGDKELADAYAMEGVVVPPKNTTLIPTIPTKIFSTNELLAYAKTTNASVATTIKPEAKQIADKVIELFKTDKYHGALIASAANGMWAMGYKESSVYLMGKAIEALPNANNYNNYASYLTMLGAAHMAIPILNKLNSAHRKNTTILNNLAQAWLQLGDEDKTNKYLDSTIMIYAYHPQANYTKCLVLESHGRHAEAIEALNRSLKHSITNKKLNKLRELEKDKTKTQPKGYHIPKVYSSSSFNLNAYTAAIPSVYAKTAGMAEENQWIAFREQISQEKEKIEARRDGIIIMMDAEGQKNTTKPAKQKTIVFPPYYHQALKRYQNYLEGERLSIKKETSEGVDYFQQWGKLKSAFRMALDAEKERYKKMEDAAGVPLPPNCDGELPIIAKYVAAINELNKKYNERLVKRLVTSYYQNYNYSTDIATTDLAALKAVLDLKIDFLQKLLELKHEHNNSIICSKENEESSYTKKELPDYDEVNCNILNTIWFPGFGSVVYRCNNATMMINSKLLPAGGSLTLRYDNFLVEQFSVAAKVKAVDIELGAKFDKDGKFVSGNGSVGTKIKGIDVSANGEIDEKGLIKGSADLGIDGELKFLPQGLEGEAPVELGLKGELGVSMDFDSEGNTDFTVKQKTEGTIASNVEIDNKVEMEPGKMSVGGKITEPETMKLPLPNAPSVSISAENSWSVNSGFSVAKGELSGIRHK